MNHDLAETLQQAFWASALAAVLLFTVHSCTGLSEKDLARKRALIDAGTTPEQLMCLESPSSTGCAVYQAIKGCSQ